MIQTYIILALAISGVVAGPDSEAADSASAPEPFSYAYDAGTHSASESKDPSGKVTGFYTITDADGRSRKVEYFADETGFHAKVQTNEVGTQAASPNPADVEVLASPPNQEQFYYYSSGGSGGENQAYQAPLAGHHYAAQSGYQSGASYQSFGSQQGGQQHGAVGGVQGAHVAGHAVQGGPASYGSYESYSSYVGQPAVVGQGGVSSYAARGPGYGGRYGGGYGHGGRGQGGWGQGGWSQGGWGQGGWGQGGWGGHGGHGGWGGQGGRWQSVSYQPSAPVGLSSPYSSYSSSSAVPVAHYPQAASGAHQQVSSAQVYAHPVAQVAQGASS